MSPINEAIKVQPISFDTSLLPRPVDVPKETTIYSGTVDPEWTIGSVPNGGYVLALILEACIQYQSTTSHVDLLHVNAHFLRATLTTTFIVCIRTIKTGSGFTNITADMLQDGIVKIMAHAIFGINGPHPKDNVNLTLNPPSKYARRHPLYTHPSQTVAVPLGEIYRFNSRVQWTREEEILAKNRVDGPNRTNSFTVGGGGLEWGTWFEFKDTNAKITTSSLAFLVDINVNTPSLLPKSERGGLNTGFSWYPTMVLSIEFKNKLPSSSAEHSTRTVGIYSRGNFVSPPQARHESYCEVWTAPANIGEGKPTSDWRDHQVCLAISTQMALVMPMEVNEKKGKSNTVKL